MSTASVLHYGRLRSRQLRVSCISTDYSFLLSSLIWRKGCLHCLFPHAHGLSEVRTTSDSSPPDQSRMDMAIDMIWINRFNNVSPRLIGFWPVIIDTYFDCNLKYCNGRLHRPHLLLVYGWSVSSYTYLVASLTLLVRQSKPTKNITIFRNWRTFLQSFDYILTVHHEIEYIWESKWNLVKILFLLTRYLPFIDCVVVFIRKFARTIPTTNCVWWDS